MARTVKFPKESPARNPPGTRARRELTTYSPSGLPSSSFPHSVPRLVTPYAKSRSSAPHPSDETVGERQTTPHDTRALPAILEQPQATAEDILRGLQADRQVAQENPANHRTAAGTGDTSTTIPRRGTADLPPGAAGPPRRALRQREHTDSQRSSSPAAANRITHRRAAAAAVTVLGIAVLLVATLGGHSTPRSPDRSKATTATAGAHTTSIGTTLSATIGTIPLELHGLAYTLRPASRSTQTRRKPARSHHRRHAHPPQPHRHTGAAVPVRIVGHSSPSPSAAPQQQASSPAPATTSTYTPASTASGTSHTSTPSQTSTPSSSSQTSAPSTSRPAVPTNSDPLGGIGSCVKGCS